MNLSVLKSPQGADPVILESEFSAPVSRLFKAWTSPEDIKQWFGSGDSGPELARVDLQEGGEWEFVFPEKDGQRDSLSGRYLRIEQDKLLEFTWIHTRRSGSGDIEQSTESVVSVEFEERPAGTFSRLIHKGVDAETSRTNIGGGWVMSLHKIKRLVE